MSIRHLTLTRSVATSNGVHERAISSSRACAVFCSWEVGGRVRVFTIDGQRWAVGADACAALEITAVGRALARLDDDDRLVLRRSDTVGSTEGIWNGFAPQVQRRICQQLGGAPTLVDMPGGDGASLNDELGKQAWRMLQETDPADLSREELEAVVGIPPAGIRAPGGAPL